MKHFLIALQFLTALPIKIVDEIKDEDYAGALVYFPAAGLIIGACLAIAAVGLSPMSRALQAAVLIIISVLLTSGLHLDGFADTCDGFSVHGPVQKRLEVMRDSRSGAMAVIGVACLLLFKFAALASISSVLLPYALVLAVGISRWLQVCGCYKTVYPRQDGKARLFVGKPGLKQVFLASLTVFLPVIILAGWAGVILLITGFAAGALFIAICNQKIQGMTGDTLGALSEIVECTVLFTFYLIQGALLR